MREGWGGSRAVSAGDDVLDAVRVLAGVSKRGKPWQSGGLALFDEGSILSGTCLRECATWLQERRRREWKRVWVRAQQRVLVDPDDPHGELADVAFHASQLARTDRGLRGSTKVIRQHVHRLDPSLSVADLRMATERSLGWRIADMVQAGSLEVQDERLARFGSEHRPAAAEWTPALDSEVMECARTITQREAYVYRYLLITLQRLREFPLLDRYLLDLLTWEVCEARINRDSGRDPGAPVSESELDDMERQIRADWARNDDGIHHDQLELFDAD